MRLLALPATSEFRSSHREQGTARVMELRSKAKTFRTALRFVPYGYACARCGNSTVPGFATTCDLPKTRPHHPAFSSLSDHRTSSTATGWVTFIEGSVKGRNGSNPTEAVFQIVAMLLAIVPGLE